MWGAQDRFATAKMAHRFHAELEGSELEIFDEAGHFPHLDDPLRFARTLEDFFHATEPARLETTMMRELVLSRDPKSAGVLERLQREHTAG